MKVSEMMKTQVKTKIPQEREPMMRTRKEKTMEKVRMKAIQMMVTLTRVTIVTPMIVLMIRNQNMTEKPLSDSRQIILT